MRKFLFILILLSCKKGSDGPAFTDSITFNLDGQQVSCNTNFKATNISGSLKLEGAWANGGAIALFIFGTVNTGEHVFSAANCHWADIWVNNVAASAGQGCSIFGPTGFYGPGKITVTEKSSSQIKGSFEFTTGTPGTVRTVTNGSFHLHL